ncbi:hypothetical protein KA005_38095 [bacterium]|nr:hypothetical protein [bacterium]
MSILGLDVGTGGSKAVVVNEKGEVMAKAYRDYNLITPCPGWLELDARLLWDSVQSIIREVARNVKGDQISVLSLSTMGDSFVPVNKTGEPIGNFILASDGRSTAETEFLINEIGLERIFQITGMPPHPINTLTKVIWLKQHDPDTFSKAAKFLCAEEYVISRLGLTPTTSYSNACRTMAFSIEKLDWSQEMMDSAGINKGYFPEAIPSGNIIGEIPPLIASPIGLGIGVKVVSGGIDQACGSLGSNAISEGYIEDSMGTLEALSLTIDKTLFDGMLYRDLLNGHYSINCHVITGKYLIMALILSAGSILRWFRDTFLKEEVQSAEKKRVSVYDLVLSKSTPDPTHLLLLPYFAGSGTPTMNPLANGIIMGLDLGVKKEDLIKAIFQGIAHEVALNLDYLEKIGVLIKEIRCVGGGSRSEFCLQLRADLLGKAVIKMRDSEAAVLGAAILAGVGIGVWGSVEEAAKYIAEEDKIFEPRSHYRKFYDTQKLIYRNLYEKVYDIFPHFESLIKEAE